MNPCVESLANPAANDTIELYLCGTALRVPCIKLAYHPSPPFGSIHPSSKIFASIHVLPQTEGHRECLE